MVYGADTTVIFRCSVFSGVKSLERAKVDGGFDTSGICNSIFAGISEPVWHLSY